MTTAEPPVSARSWARTSPFAGILRRPVTAAALAVVAAVTLAVVLAPLLAPAPPLAQDLLNALSGPSAEHPLGTDALGRDVLSRLLYGGRPALFGVGLAVLVHAVVGMSLGIVAGYLRGWTDRVIVAVLDVMLSVPAIILTLAVLAIFHQSNVAAMLTLGFFASASLARTIRSSCVALREELFADAARVSGLGPARIMARHVFPGLVGQLLVQVCLFAGIALAVQTGLGFLGMATPAPALGRHGRGSRAGHAAGSVPAARLRGRDRPDVRLVRAAGRRAARSGRGAAARDRWPPAAAAGSRGGGPGRRRTVRRSVGHVVCRVVPPTGGRGRPRRAGLLDRLRHPAGAAYRRRLHRLRPPPR